MPSRIFPRVFDIVWRRDIEYAEIQGAILAILWAVWFLIADWVGIQGDLKVVYMTLTQIFPRGMWGVILGVLGFAQLYALIFTLYRLRRFLAMLATVIWLFIGIFLSLGEWRAFSCPTAFAFALGSAWGYIRLGRLYSDKGLGSGNVSDMHTVKQPERTLLFRTAQSR